MQQSQKNPKHRQLSRPGSVARSQADLRLERASPAVSLSVCLLFCSTLIGCLCTDTTCLTDHRVVRHFSCDILSEKSDL